MRKLQARVLRHSDEGYPGYNSGLWYRWSMPIIRKFKRRSEVSWQDLNKWAAKNDMAAIRLRDCMAWLNLNYYVSWEKNKKVWIFDKTRV